MDKNQIDLWVASNKDKFNPTQMSEICSKLEQADTRQIQLVMATDFKNPTHILILSILSTLGFDRTALDQIWLSGLKAITVGGLGIWWIIDITTAKKRAQEYNYKLLMSVL